MMMYVTENRFSRPPKPVIFDANGHEEAIKHLNHMSKGINKHKLVAIAILPTGPRSIIITPDRVKRAKIRKAEKLARRRNRH